MPDAGENSDERKDAKRASGASRRIVVEESSKDRLPRATGRKLDSPDKSVDDLGHGNHGSLGTGQRTIVGPGLRRSSKQQVKVRRLVMIAGGIIAVLIVVPLIAVVLRSARNKKNEGTRSSAAATMPVTTSPTPVTVEVASPQQSTAPGPDVETPANAEGLVEVESAEVRLMVLQLASQISQKGGYEFGPEFIELIRGRTQEYSSDKALVGARQFRREINKSFRDQGLNPLVGYVLAMSRSKFDPVMAQKGVGIWQLPVGVARSQGYLGATENSAKLKIPETSAQIAASYTRQLLSAFDTEDFMYAIACFGMSLQEAGQLQARLVNAAPDAKSRRDVMKVIKAGVLTSDQVDNIARFFAAGIVGENPEEFGLSNSQPLSSLY